MRFNDGSVQLSATDLAKHLGCRALTELDRAVADGTRSKPDWASPMLALLRDRGLVHEAAYVAGHKIDGRHVVDLGDLGPEGAVEQTAEAMRAGADVIVQAALEDGKWNGRPDILLKVAGSSDLGSWSYEVLDTKLAQETRGGTVLQLCLYTDLVAKVQGVVPELMHVVKPGEELTQETFRFADFQAYYRLVRAQLEASVQVPPTDVYPLPVPQCDVCAWWKTCDEKRHEDDHLCLVAGIQTVHINELNRQGITTLEQFADHPTPLREKPERGREEAYARAHHQARVQLDGRRRSEPVYELLSAEEGEGLFRLPVSDDGDIFFDFEADPFVDGGGLEYLFGFVFQEGAEYRYRSIWGLDRDGERRAFEEFMDFVAARWEEHPGMHIYHFAPYEPAALKRLMGRHATRGPELDRLLRAERFVDLHAVVKRGLRASVEGYSLKDLEPFFGFARGLPLPDASAALRRVERSLEMGEPGGVDDSDKNSVEAYNREDCESTLQLRSWLEERRAELVAKDGDLGRPELKGGDASDAVEQRDATIQAVFDDLVGGLPEDSESWGSIERAQWLLAHQLEYYVREEKCAWWEFFRVHELEPDELLDERKAITELDFVGEVDGGTARCPAHRYRFPTQEASLKINAEAHEVGAERVGTVLGVDQAARTVDIKKMQRAVDHHPSSIMEKEVVAPAPLDASILALARSVVDFGVAGDGPFRAARDLLLKRPPRFAGGSTEQEPLRQEGEDVVAGAIRLAEDLDGGCLPIQGPPGTGKTYTGARMIVALAQAGKRVGVTAVSHKVIRNLLDEALDAAEKDNLSLLATHKCTPFGDAPDGLEEVRTNDAALDALNNGRVVGGTAWLWARPDAAESLDYLFVDEAGQMSLVNTLAAARAARNLVLLGDPQQLEQPQKGAHPEGSEVSALEHVLDGAKTLPSHRGLFLDVTWRLHPRICAFTSELFYEGRLESRPDLEHQAVLGDTPFAGSGLFFVPVEHEGNQTASAEEVRAIESVISSLVGRARWMDADGQEHPLEERNIVVVAPYNAQVGALTVGLPEGVRVGTVDKFQGQQAPVVIYSMTSSSAEDAPRGMGFLFSPNRLNVATSRARCVSIVVAATRLLEPSCRTPDQMRWANGLCRYRELAHEVRIDTGGAE